MGMYVGMYVYMGVVTPRSCEYEDVTVTYICKSKILSCIYAKHQYR